MSAVADLQNTIGKREVWHARVQDQDGYGGNAAKREPAVLGV